MKALKKIASILCFSSVHLWTSGEWECQSGDLSAAADRLLYTSAKSPWQHSQRNLPLHLGKDPAQSYFIWRTGERSMTRGALACGFVFSFSLLCLLTISRLSKSCSKQIFILRAQCFGPVHRKPEHLGLCRDYRLSLHHDHGPVIPLLPLIGLLQWNNPWAAGGV